MSRVSLGLRRGCQTECIQFAPRPIPVSASVSTLSVASSAICKKKTIEIEKPFDLFRCLFRKKMFPKNASSLKPLQIFFLFVFKSKFRILQLEKIEQSFTSALVFLPEFHIASFSPFLFFSNYCLSAFAAKRF